MDEQRENMLKYLRLTGLSKNWEQTLKLARKRRMSHAALLTHVIEQEYELRSESARNYRLRRAQIPALLLMETYPFDRQPKLDRKPERLNEFLMASFTVPVLCTLTFTVSISRLVRDSGASFSVSSVERDRIPAFRRYPDCERRSSAAFSRR